MFSFKPLHSSRPAVRTACSDGPVYDWGDFSALLEKLKTENGSTFEQVGIQKNFNRLLAWADEIREGDDLPGNVVAPSK